jgi:hypothetical protein
MEEEEEEEEEDDDDDDDYDYEWKCLNNTSKASARDILLQYFSLAW